MYGVEDAEEEAVGVVVRMPKGVGSGIEVVVLAATVAEAVVVAGRRSFLIRGELVERTEE
jgi:hypothetical protein